MEIPFLSLLVFLPVFAGILFIFLPGDKTEWFRKGTLSVALLQLALGIFLFISQRNGMNPEGLHAYSFVEQADWISLNLGGYGLLKITYFLGMDGLSAGLIVLTGLIIVIASLSSKEITESVKGYFILFLLMDAAIMGSFLALDLFLFFLFFEFMLFPMYFLIGIWGGPQRTFAAIKFFIFTLFGSILILLVFIGLSLSVSEPGQSLTHTFSLTDASDPSNYIPGSILALENPQLLFGLPVRLIAFLILMAGFLVKLPSVPLHTWLPLAHVEAPTPVSVLLAALLLKVGAYGIIRIGGAVFPEGILYFSQFIGLLGVLSILYAGLNALAQSDLKRMIAYSSVAHMGFVLLGLASITSLGVTGAVFQLVSHGILSAMLFLIAGVLFHRTSNRNIADYQGLISVMPKFSVVVIIAFFASLGLPGFSGFIAEILILLGAFQGAVSGNTSMSIWVPVFALPGLLIGAAYFLWTYQKMFLGSFWVKEPSVQKESLTDLTTGEWIIFLPLLLATVLLGLFPPLLTDSIQGYAQALVSHIETVGQSNLKLILP